MSLNVINHLHNIELLEPAFSKYYNDTYRKIDYKRYHDDIVMAIKNHLRSLVIEESRDVGVAITTDTMLYKPLVASGLRFDDVVYIIREFCSEEVGYLTKNQNSPDVLALTMKGKNWIFDMNNNKEIGVTDPISKINYFDIPDKSSKKIKTLLTEVNNLPAYEPYPNLIGHQLRTLLALILVEVCGKLLKVFVPKDKRDLKPLLNFTVEQCKLAKEKRLAEELEHLRDTKYKDIIDDVVHCDYTTVNADLIKEIMLKIKHTISLAYRDI